MRLPRFTTRRLMVLVAVAAVLIGCAVRRQRFLMIAGYHGADTVANQYCTPEQVRAIARFNTWNQAMRRKYRLAASLPFLPVVPDPPRPQ